jgi:MoaA/NifB/PqqE/SkfB family radical SAM enzyme
MSILDTLRAVALGYDMNFRGMKPWPRMKALMRTVMWRMGRSRAPRNMLIALTDACQCSCRHCGVANLGAGKNNELEFEQIARLLKEYRRLGGVKFSLFGGEPLLRKDILEIVALSTSLGLSSVLCTNGLLLTEQLAVDLRKAGLCAIEFSLDSMDPKRFDRIRGYRGIHERVITAIRDSIRVGFKVGINIVASRDHLNGGLREVIEFARGEGVRAIRVLEPITSGRWGNKMEQALSEEELGQLKAHLEPGFVYWESQDNETGGCSAVRGDLMYIGTDGNVQPCPYLQYSLGNALETPLEELLPNLRRMSKCHNDKIGCPVNDTDFREKYGLDKAPPVKASRVKAPAPEAPPAVVQ